jgi:hypothetical protein
VDSTCRIVIWKLEVADHYARKAIESFEIDVLAEGNTTKNCTKSSNSKLVGVNCPIEARAMQKERGKLGEPPGNAVSVIYLPGTVYPNLLSIVGNREAGIRVVVRDSNIGGSTDLKL